MWLIVGLLGLLHAHGQCGPALEGIDLNGNDVQPACSAHARSDADCCKQCSLTPSCRAFTWIAAGTAGGGGQCCLKTSAAGRRTVAGHVSGCLLSTTATSANCSAPPPSPPPPLPPPPSPPIPWGTPPLPSWPATCLLHTIVESITTDEWRQEFSRCK